MNCTTFFIYENILKELVLKQLNDKISTYSHKKVENDDKANSLENEILKIENKLNSLRRLKVDIYEKYVENTISKDKYLTEKSYIEKSINNFNQNLNELNLPINNLENDKILNYQVSLDNLNRDIIDKVIEKIYIYNGQKIKICWKNN